MISWLTPTDLKIRNQSLFNHMAAAYARRVLSRGHAQRRQDVAWMNPQPHERVLDLACGPGTLARELARHARAVYGLDLAEQMIRQARRVVRRPNTYFSVADGERLPLPANCFDLVACSFSFANFPAPQHIADEMQRVTRPGGRIAVLEAVTPENGAQRGRWNRLERLRSGVPARVPCLSDLLALFYQAGLHLLECHVERRRQRLDDWLALSAYGNDRRARQRLQQTLLRAANKQNLGVPLCREGGRWCLYPAVVRLLWRK